MREQKGYLDSLRPNNKPGVILTWLIKSLHCYSAPSVSSAQLRGGEEIFATQNSALIAINSIWMISFLLRFQFSSSKRVLGWLLIIPTPCWWRNLSWHRDADFAKPNSTELFTYSSVFRLHRKSILFFSSPFIRFGRKCNRETWKKKNYCDICIIPSFFQKLTLRLVFIKSILKTAEHSLHIGQWTGQDIRRKWLLSMCSVHLLAKHTRYSQMNTFRFLSHTLEFELELYNCKSCTMYNVHFIRKRTAHLSHAIQPLIIIISVFVWPTCCCQLPLPPFIYLNISFFLSLKFFFAHFFSFLSIRSNSSEIKLQC